MTKRMPVAFLPHGGGPVTHVEMGFAASDVEAIGAYWRGVRDLPPASPKALLVVSAHWESAVPTVMSSPHPPMYYDYYGFPPEAYRLTWPAPGHPELAAHVRELLGRAGFATAADGERGFDHGTFTPLKQTYPDAEVPVVQLSLMAGLDAALHLRLGRALAPLRDEGVFIIGSGDSFHNLRSFGPAAREPSQKFNAWLTAAVTGDAGEREKKLAGWEAAPAARVSHPREDHLIPLMVVAGAAETDVGVETWRGWFLGSEQVGWHFG